MTPELWARLNPLFNAVVEMPPDEQDAFIAEACGGDAELRNELQALVVAHARQEATTDRVAEGLRELINKATARYRSGDLIHGRFRIVRLLGSGGMGEVYEAFDLELSQKVALKLADFVVNETGFASDLGFEKYMDLVSPASGIKPSAAVLVTTVQSLKNQGQSVDNQGEGDLQRGFANLEKHIAIVRGFLEGAAKARGLPPARR